MFLHKIIYTPPGVINLLQGKSSVFCSKNSVAAINYLKRRQIIDSDSDESFVCSTPKSNESNDLHSSNMEQKVNNSIVSYFFENTDKITCKIMFIV